GKANQIHFLKGQPGYNSLGAEGERSMINRFSLGAALGLGSLSAGALGPAGAESALTNATSATSVAGVGSRLGHTLDQTTKKLSDRVQNNVGHSAQRPSEKKPSSPAPSQASKS